MFFFFFFRKIDESAKNSAAVATIDESFKSHLGHGLPNVPLLMGSYHRATYEWNNMYKKLKVQELEAKLLISRKVNVNVNDDFLFAIFRNDIEK